MVRRYWALGAVSVGSLIGACSPAQERVSSRNSAIVNGVLAEDNNPGALRVIQGGQFSGSAVLGPTDSTALTAAHVVATTAPGALNIQLEDRFEEVTATGVTSFVRHPTFARDVLLSQTNAQSPKNIISTEDVIWGEDVALMFLNGGINTDDPAKSLPRPIAPQPLLANAAVTAWGYGDEAAQQNNVPLDLREYDTTIKQVVQVSLAMQSGPALPFLGTAYEIFPDSAGRRLERGDSGGPLTDGTGSQIFGLNTSVNEATGVGHVTGLNSVTNWINVLLQAQGRRTEFDFNDRGRSDQLVVPFNGSSDTVLVEFGEGGETLALSVPRPAGAPASPFVPDLSLAIPVLGKGVATAVGHFGVPLSAGALPADVVGLVGGQIMVILDVTGTPSSILLSSPNSYTSAAVLDVNGDGFDDIEAFGSGGLIDFFYGTGSTPQLTPGFSFTHRNSCRSGMAPAKNGCGGKAFLGDCFCGSTCTQNCCADSAEVCGPSVLNDVLQEHQQLLAAGPLPLNNVSSSSGMVSIAVPTAQGNVPAAGVFLDQNWVLTASAPLQNATGNIAVKQGATSIGIQRVLQHPDAGLALLRVAPGANVSLPSGATLDFYAGTEDLVSEESNLLTFGTAGSGFAAASFPGTAALPAVQPHSGNSTPQLSLVAPTSVVTGVNLVPGSPIIASNPASATGGTASALVGIVTATRSSTFTPPAPQSPVTLTVEDAVPLFNMNQLATDRRASPRYWLRHVIDRSKVRDADGDGFHDIWGVDTSNDIVAFSVAGSSPASSPVAQSAPFDQTGNWRLVGRALLGGPNPSAVWHEADTGQVVVQLTSGTNADGELSFFVDPVWDLRALGDIDGDGLADFLWTSTLQPDGTFWLSNAVTSASLAGLNANPASLLRESGWFGSLGGLDPNAGYDLVAAEHFTPPTREGLAVSGPEQAAVDLVWRARNGVTTLLSQMAYFIKPCSSIADPLILRDACGNSTTSASSVRTYEASGNIAQLDDEPSDSHVVGVADYDFDGNIDMAWQAGASDPNVDPGHIFLWLGQPDGTFAQQDTSAGASFDIDPGQFTLSAN